MKNPPPYPPSPGYGEASLGGYGLPGSANFAAFCGIVRLFAGFLETFFPGSCPPHYFGGDGASARVSFWTD
jgi:hypothetical protein